MFLKCRTLPINRMKTELNVKSHFNGETFISFNFWDGQGGRVWRFVKNHIGGLGCIPPAQIIT